jgi:4-deoxy-L-threo-5-hexosulose-uronate ketol-isomerase
MFPLPAPERKTPLDIRHATHPDQLPTLDTDALRRHYLVQDLFPTDRFRFVYTHHDRMVVGGTTPTAPVILPTYDPLRADYFCQRRELGTVNVGGPGEVVADGTAHHLDTHDVLYVGRGTREIEFRPGSGDPARFYLVSTPAHADLPTVRATRGEGTRLGETEHANQRVLRRVIAPDGIASCQLTMGVTEILPGSVWNTMPCHTHDRRTEVYLYTGLPAGERVVHLLGRPDETRHLLVADNEAVISPSWSVHFGAGTASYAFVWAMAGESREFTDMDQVTVADLR